MTRCTNCGGQRKTPRESFRDHARDMVRRTHTRECGASKPHRWGGAVWITPDPECTGCISDKDRALWTRLADEVDAYLTTDEDEGLFA